MKLFGTQIYNKKTIISGNSRKRIDYKPFARAYIRFKRHVNLVIKKNENIELNDNTMIKLFDIYLKYTSDEIDDNEEYEE